MTVVYDSQNANNPKTHVLIVGVGWYHELEFHSGNKWRSKFPGLQADLSSAVESAKVLADWFIGKCHNPDVPLGTVELLLTTDQPTCYYTPPQPGGLGQLTVDQASIREIQASFAKWFDYCNEDSDNVAVMYFAGHGIECASKLLLASDFLENINSPMAAVVDYDATFNLMARCRARNQFFFIDSCRLPNYTINLAPPNDLMHVLRAMPLPVPTGRPNLSRNSLQLFATQMGKEASGPAGQPSRFVEALRNHLDELGACKSASSSSADWRVDHEHLGKYVLRSMLRDDKLKQRQLPDRQAPEVWPQSNFESSVIHRLSGVPIVPVRFGCTPESANQFADFFLTDENGQIQPLQATKHGKEPFDLPQRPGTYTFEATFQSGSYKKGASRVLVDTPFADLDVDVL